MAPLQSCAPPVTVAPMITVTRSLRMLVLTSRKIESLSLLEARKKKGRRNTIKIGIGKRTKKGTGTGIGETATGTRAKKGRGLEIGMMMIIIGATGTGSKKRGGLEIGMMMIIIGAKTMTGREIMTKTEGISIDLVQGLDLSTYQGHVLVHAPKDRLFRVFCTFLSLKDPTSEALMPERL